MSNIKNLKNKELYLKTVKELLQESIDEIYLYAIKNTQEPDMQEGFTNLPKEEIKFMAAEFVVAMLGMDEDEV